MRTSLHPAHSRALTLLAGLSATLCLAATPALAQPGHDDEDEETRMATPVTPSFPWAPPANQHLYHYMGLDGRKIMAGSASDHKYRHMKEEDMRRSEQMEKDRQARLSRSGMTAAEEDMKMALPIMPVFPFAPPANQHLFHYMGIAGHSIMPGSAKDHREMMMAEEDKMRVDQFQKDYEARLAREGITAEEDVRRMALPVVPMFPWAPPANQHLFHYMGLDRVYAMPGSAKDAMEKRMMDEDRMRLEQMEKDRAATGGSTGSMRR